MTIVYRLLSVLIGYAFGNLTFGYYIGKHLNVDIRKQGSGNIGTTNTLRILGLKAGIWTLILDCLKAILAALMAWLIFSHVDSVADDFLPVIRLYAAFGAVLGHDFPALLKFKGGKGIATSFGFLIVVAPKMLIFAIPLFVILVAIYRYISLGSIMCAISVIIMAWTFAPIGWLNLPESYAYEGAIILTIVGCLATYLHRANIDRLLHHKENKFTFHPNTSKENKNG